MLSYCCPVKLFGVRCLLGFYGDCQSLSGVFIAFGSPWSLPRLILHRTTQTNHSIDCRLTNVWLRRWEILSPFRDKFSPFWDRFHDFGTHEGRLGFLSTLRDSPKNADQILTTFWDNGSIIRDSHSTFWD